MKTTRQIHLGKRIGEVAFIAMSLLLFSACGLSKKALENRLEQEQATSGGGGGGGGGGASVNLQSGLIASYEFDNLTGAIALDSAGSNNGTVIGTNTVLGKSGNALEFDSISDRVQIPYTSSHSVPQLSLSTWIKWSGGNGYNQRIVERSKNAAESQAAYSLTINGIGQLIISAEISGVQHSFNTGIFIPGGTWVHLVYTYDGNNKIFYINGQLAATRYAPGVLNGYAEAHGLSIGNQFNTNNPFNGTIDWVCIWNRAINHDEVVALYNMQK